MNLEDLKPPSNGPTAEEVYRAKQIVERHDVLWAIDVLRRAEAAKETPDPRSKSS